MNNLLRKIFLFGITFGCLQIAFGQVQAKKDSFDNVNLEFLLKELEKRHSITFSYANSLVSGLKIDTIVSVNELQHSLSLLQKYTNFKFEAVENNSYLISPLPLPICMKIQDGNTPLNGVLASSNGQYLPQSSDANGTLQFTSNLTIRDTVYLHYIGYETLPIPVKSLYTAPCLSINMTFGSTVLKELIITNYLVSGIDANPLNHSLEIKTDDMALLPGETDGDILLSLKMLPGITTPSGKAGSLHVRGSTTDQTMITFDHIPIYHKGHYQGTISPYNPLMVEQVKVFRSGYEAKYGGRVAGVIALETSNEVPANSAYSVGINSYFGSAFAVVPIIKDKLSFSGAIRQSFPSDWNSPKLQAINDMVLMPSDISFIIMDPNRDLLNYDFTFRDINAKMNYQLHNGNISASLLEVKNETFLDVQNNRRGTIEKRKTELNNLGLNINWDQKWSTKFSSTLSLMHSDYSFESGNREDPTMGTSFYNGIEDLGVFADFILKTNLQKGDHFNFGYNYNQQDVIRKSRILNNPDPSPISISEMGKLHSAYANFTSNSIDRLIINFGFRVNQYNITEEFNLEPRLFLNYALTPKFNLKASSGTYSQYINQEVYFDFEDSRAENQSWKMATEDFPVVKGRQAMFGAIFQDNDWMVDLELYAKKVDNLSTKNPTAKGPEAPNQKIQGTLGVIGMDFLIRKQWKYLSAWASYTYSGSDMQFEDLNTSAFKTYYDQPHVLNLVGSYIQSKWKASLGWSLSSGTPNYLNSDFFPKPGPPIPGAPVVDYPVDGDSHDGRFPVQHQLDASLVYLFENKNKTWDGSIGLSLLNIMDVKNIVEESYLSFGPLTSQETRYAIGFAPNLMLQINF